MFEQFRLIPATIIASSLLFSCSSDAPKQVTDFYLALDTSSPELRANSEAAIEAVSEDIRPGGRLIVDHATGGHSLSNDHSAIPSDETFNALREGLKDVSANPDTSAMAMQRAANLLADLPKDQALTIIIISSGTNNPTVLNQIRKQAERLSSLPHQSARLMVIGVDPEVRIPFAAAFEPAKEIVKFASSTSEFNEQFNNLQEEGR